MVGIWLPVSNSVISVCVSGQSVCVSSSLSVCVSVCMCVLDFVVQILPGDNPEFEVS